MTLTKKYVIWEVAQIFGFIIFGTLGLVLGRGLFAVLGLAWFLACCAVLATFRCPRCRVPLAGDVDEPFSKEMLSTFLERLVPTRCWHCRLELSKPHDNDEH